MSEVWALKYRPNMDEIVGQDLIKEKVLPNGKTFYKGLLQHYIFYSPQAGTGKTSLAHAMADKLNWPIHVFNASSKKTRGIEFVEEHLLPMSRTGNSNQFFLLDEADQLTPAAQSALKGVIENAQGYFILTCNDLTKISRWLQSRCVVCHFNPISDEDSMARLAVIAGNEGVEVTQSQLNMIVKAHKGDLRNAINAFQVFASLDVPQQMRFLHSLDSKNNFDINTWRKQIKSPQDFQYAVRLIQDSPDSRKAIQYIFSNCMDDTSVVVAKLKIIDAAITAERDFLMGVEENIVINNFVGMYLA